MKQSQEDIVALKKELSDTRAELGRTTMQLVASVERRRQFSSKAMRMLVGQSDSVLEAPSDEDVLKNTVEILRSASIKPQQQTNPKRLPARAKSWSVPPSTSSDTADEEALDCPLPYSFSAVVSKKKETGVQTSQLPLNVKKDRLIPRPNRSRSKSRDGRSRDESYDSIFDFDSDSKTPSARGGGSANASELETACSKEACNIEITSSTVSHLSDATVDTGFIASTVSLITSHLRSKQCDGDAMVQKGKVWKTMMKRMKGLEEDMDMMTAGGSTSDVSCCNSFYSVDVGNNEGVVTACQLATLFAVASFSVAVLSKETGYGYTGGVLNIFDSGLIVGGASILLMLVLKCLCDMAKQTWTLLRC